MGMKVAAAGAPTPIRIQRHFDSKWDNRGEVFENEATSLPTINTNLSYTIS